MGLLKPKTEKKTEQTEQTEPVSRAEYEALSAQLETFKTIACLAVAAIGVAMKASPGMPDSNARVRLEKLAAFLDLESAERAELKCLFEKLDKFGKAESRREVAERQARAAPRTFDNSRPPMNWRG